MNPNDWTEKADRVCAVLERLRGVEPTNEERAAVAQWLRQEFGETQSEDTETLPLPFAHT